MPILGLCWPHLGAMLAHLGPMLAHLGAHVGPIWGLCWPILRHFGGLGWVMLSYHEPQKRKKNQKWEGHKTLQIAVHLETRTCPSLLRRGEKCLRQCHGQRRRPLAKKAGVSTPKQRATESRKVPLAWDCDRLTAKNGGVASVPLKAERCLWLLAAPA